MKNIGILGFGVVGSGVAEVIHMNGDKIAKRVGEEIRVKRILDLRDFPDSLFADLITHDAEEFFGDPDISIVVETIGGARIAYEYTKRALSLGKSVVTSNKELVATHGVELMEIASQNDCSYMFEAAVGGGIPIIRPLHKCLAANKIMRIAGIVNGTTNYILTNMRDSGLTYEDALKQAQKMGYAEQDPTADVEGIDAQRKLSILSTIALDGAYVSPNSIHTEGISKITLNDIIFAESINCSVKLLARFDHPFNGKPACFVAPHFVSHNAIISGVDGVFNAIMVEGNALGESMFYGQGAGKLATASAVVGDIIDSALHRHKDAHITKWYNSDEKVENYEDIKISAVVRSNDLESVKKAFDDYQTEEVAENAIIVKDIAHKDIDKIIGSLSGATYLHYME